MQIGPPGNSPTAPTRVEILMYDWSVVGGRSGEPAASSMHPASCQDRLTLLRQDLALELIELFLVPLEQTPPTSSPLLSASETATPHHASPSLLEPVLQTFSRLGHRGFDALHSSSVPPVSSHGSQTEECRVLTLPKWVER